jgi:hypothetical protein
MFQKRHEREVLRQLRNLEMDAQRLGALLSAGCETPDDLPDELAHRLGVVSDRLLSWDRWLHMLPDDDGDPDPAVMAEARRRAREKARESRPV